MLKFVGTGSAFNTKLGNNSAYIKEGNKLFLIDCGSANFHRMKESGLLDDVDFINVFITHTHADHVGSLADLIFYMYYCKGEQAPRVEVIAHKRCHVGKYLEMNGVEPHQYALQEVFEGQVVEIVNGELDLGFTALNTSHVDNLVSTGLIIYNARTDEKCIYTGDTSDLNSSIVDLLEDEETPIDYLYVDTCSQDYEGNVHLSLFKLSAKIHYLLRSKVWCMHLDEKFDIELTKKLGFNVAEVEM